MMTCALAPGVAALLLLACGEGAGAPNDPGNPLVAVELSPDTTTLQAGQTVQFQLTGRTRSGATAPVTPVFTAGGGTISPAGMFTAGSAAGVFRVSASVAGTTLADTATVTIREVQPPGGDPQPDANDRILVDVRQSLQKARTMGELDCAFKSWWTTCTPTQGSPGLETDETSLALDIDGRGTHAIRFSWQNSKGQCVDDGRTWPVLLKGAPKRVYMQWKMRMGRTATGGGIGALNSFQITNAACGNAGRKLWLVLRDVPDKGGYGRVDFIWPGPAPVDPMFTGGTPNLKYNQGKTFQPQHHVGEVIVHTVYLQAESSPGARDGVARLWINGTLMISATGLDIGETGFHRFQFPNTFRAPVQDQTEYFWDVVAWEPVP